MSDTISASGVQALEPKLGMSGRASAAGSPSGIYEVQNHSGVEWYRVTIAPGKTQDGDVWTLHAEGYAPFSGTASVDFAPFRHVKFTSDADPGEAVYASLIDNDDDDRVPMLTLTYIQAPKTIDPATPPTGVWLGTSSGGQRHPQVKA